MGGCVLPLIFLHLQRTATTATTRKQLSRPPTKEVAPDMIVFLTSVDMYATMGLVKQITNTYFFFSLFFYFFFLCKQ